VQIINWATTPYTIDATGATTGQLVQFDTANVKLKPVPVYYNSSNGNVGIGITSPTQKLHVAGNIGIQAGANAFIGTVDNYNLSLRTNNTDRIVIDTSGRVGIGGVTSPQASLHVGGVESIHIGYNGITYPTTPSSGVSIVGEGAYSDFRLSVTDGSNRVNMYWNAYYDTSANAHKYIVSNEPACRFLEGVNGSTGCLFQFFGAPGGTAGNNISWTQVAEFASGANVWLSARGMASDFYITSGGNVGIGTTTPAGKLEVAGSFYTATGEIRIYPQNTTTEGGQLTLLGAGSYGYVYIDNNNGRFRIITPDSVGESAKFILDSNGNVSIGTFVPSYKLHVAGNIGIQAGENAFIGTVDNYNLSLRTNNTDRIVIDTSGRVGIGGVTSPQANLHVGGGESIYFGGGNSTYPTTPSSGSGVFVGKSGTSDFRLVLQDGSGRVNMYWNAYYDASTGVHRYIVSNEYAGRFFMSTEPAGFTFRFYGASAGTAGSTISWTQLAEFVKGVDVWLSPRGVSSDFYIDPNGNIGIGTTTPSYKLDVIGDIRSASSGYVYIHSATSNSDSSYIRVVSSTSITNNPFVSLGYGSYLGVCSIYLNISDKSFRLNISKTSDGNNLRDAIIIPPANGTQTACIIPSWNGGYTGDWPSGWGGGLATYDISCGSIYYNGLLQRSDASIKTDIQSLSDYLNTDSLDVISCLKPVKYVYVNDPLNTNRFGFIAQDVSEVCPELVTIDTEGKASLNYMDLIALLTRGIQELYEMLGKVIEKIGGIS
jgi:hypothetical protein